MIECVQCAHHQLFVPIAAGEWQVVIFKVVFLAFVALKP